ncbi:MAG: hypothetical protein AMJ56_19620 [Anaerolineae bacterium SG8_19]|nr:MAG: hypothetical protein AMJ56_19620 [Anaerolineae bacterium SG8_19]
MPKRYTWLILILLAAASLRLVGLSEIPPGLTHDEADHGLDAWGVVNGIRPVYFTVGYGREPFFDYATAGLMAFLGPTYLAGRLTAVYLSLILIAGTYVWSRRAFGNTTALLTAAGLAVSFWAVLTGRQALRSIALPAIFVLAVYFYWRAAEKSKSPSFNQEEQEYPAFPFFYKPVAYYLVAGILLGLTFYTYIPARVIWLLFPALLLFLALFDRNRFQGIWAGTLLTLLVAGILALPLILYLTGNPSAEVRLAELMAPLNSAAAGDLQPLLENVTQSSLVLAFRGDSLVPHHGHSVLRRIRYLVVADLGRHQGSAAFAGSHNQLFHHRLAVTGFHPRAADRPRSEHDPHRRFATGALHLPSHRSDGCLRGPGRTQTAGPSPHRHPVPSPYHFHGQGLFPRLG